MTVSDEASGDEALEAFDMLVEEVERRCGVGVTQHEPDDEPHLDALYYFVRQALRARQQSQVPDEAAFLLDRLREFEQHIPDDESAREWHGHVAPSIARLERAIARHG